MKKMIVCLLLIICLMPAALAVPVLPRIPMVGFEAPDFEIELVDGETFKLSEQRGKVVLINIWATWCGPCVAEMPEIDQLAKDYEDDLVVIGVNAGEREQTVIDFVEKNGYGYLFAADMDYHVSGELYPSRGIPYTIVVDPYGVISELHVGGGAGVYDLLESYVLTAMEAENPAGYDILA